jgi:hypothetical protein
MLNTLNHKRSENQNDTDSMHTSQESKQQQMLAKTQGKGTLYHVAGKVNRCNLHDNMVTHRKS